MRPNYIDCPTCKEDYRFKCSSCGAEYKIGEGQRVPTVDELRICRECGQDQLAEKNRKD
jgi:hypothetical protein